MRVVLAGDPGHDSCYAFGYTGSAKAFVERIDASVPRSSISELVRRLLSLLCGQPVLICGQRQDQPVVIAASASTSLDSEMDQPCSVNYNAGIRPEKLVEKAREERREEAAFIPFRGVSSRYKYRNGRHAAYQSVFQVDKPKEGVRHFWFISL